MPQLRSDAIKVVTDHDGWSAYDVRSNKRLWTRKTEYPLVEPIRLPDGDVVLLRSELGSIARMGRTGQVRWVHNLGLDEDPTQCVSDGRTLVFQSGSRTWPVWNSLEEAMWVYRAQLAQEKVQGCDLATGRIVWTRTAFSVGVILGVHSPGEMVSIREEDPEALYRGKVRKYQLARWDMGTGKLLDVDRLRYDRRARLALDRLDDWDSTWINFGYPLVADKTYRTPELVVDLEQLRVTARS